MLNVLDEDVLDILAEAFTKRILNTESEFIWKKPDDDEHVIRYPLMTLAPTSSMATILSRGGETLKMTVQAPSTGSCLSLMCRTPLNGGRRRGGGRREGRRSAKS